MANACDESFGGWGQHASYSAKCLAEDDEEIAGYPPLSSVAGFEENMQAVMECNAMFVAVEHTISRPQACDVVYGTGPWHVIHKARPQFE